VAYYFLIVKFDEVVNLQYSICFSPLIVEFLLQK
jgi:hypothetical protein